MGDNRDDTVMVRVNRDVYERFSLYCNERGYKVGRTLSRLLKRALDRVKAPQKAEPSKQ